MKTMTPFLLAAVLACPFHLCASYSNVVYFNGFVFGEEMFLEWTLSDNHQVSEMIIERAVDVGGNEFEVLETMIPDADLLYLYTDKDPHRGLNHYRIKLVDADGTQISKTLSFEFEAAEVTFTVFPNPSPREVYVHLPGNCSIDHQYAIKAYNSVGQLVFAQKVPQFFVQFELDAMEDVDGDIYTLQLWEGNSLVKTSRIVKQ